MQFFGKKGVMACNNMSLFKAIFYIDKIVLHWYVSVVMYSIVLTCGKLTQQRKNILYIHKNTFVQRNISAIAI